jgi:hypothetical protein
MKDIAAMRAPNCNILRIPTSLLTLFNAQLCRPFHYRSFRSRRPAIGGSIDVNERSGWFANVRH